MEQFEEDVAIRGASGAYGRSGGVADTTRLRLAPAAAPCCKAYCGYGNSTLSVCIITYDMSGPEWSK